MAAPQIVDDEVGVADGRRDGPVAQETLHDVDVDAGADQLGREGVAPAVREVAAGHAGAPTCQLDLAVDGFRAEAAVGGGDEPGGVGQQQWRVGELRTDLVEERPEDGADRRREDDQPRT